MRSDKNGGSKPNYYPNSFSDLPQPDPEAARGECYTIKTAQVSRGIPQKWKDQDDYAQPRALWEGMSEEDKTQTVNNIAGHLGGAKDFIQKRQIGVFSKVSPDLGKRVEEMIPKKKETTEPYTMTA